MGNATWSVRHNRVFHMCQHAMVAGGLAFLIIILVSTHVWSQGNPIGSTPQLLSQSVAATNTNSSSPSSDAKMRWIGNNPEKVSKGKALFAACGACHGMQGEGRQGIGPRLNSETFLAAASDDFLVQTISQGRAGTTMIPWGASFQADDIQSIVAYIRSLNPVPAATLNQSPLKGDAARGAKLYASICAACHGNSGAGYQETANGTGIGRAAFLNTVSDGFLRYIIKHGKSGTPMRPFDKDSKVAVANLTEQQVDDVIVHLRSQSW